MRMQPQQLITLTGVTKRYGREQIMDIHSLAFERGDKVLLTGNNGSGKSTLLRLIGGVSTVTSGKVWRAPSLRDGGVGYVPQSGGLYGELTVRANLALRRRLWDKPEINPEPQPYIQCLGLEGVLDKRTGAL